MKSDRWGPLAWGRRRPGQRPEIIDLRQYREERAARERRERIRETNTPTPDDAA